MAPRLLSIGLILAASTAMAAATEPTRADKAVPADRGALQLSFAPVARKAAPAVVNIYARHVERQSVASPLLDDPVFRHFFGDQFGEPRERVRNSLGSGVIVRPNGLIVTNHHVVKDAGQITVVLADRREFPAKVVTSDERADLAILKIDTGPKPLSYLELRDSDDLEVGDLVLAIGDPFGVGQTVTSGIVSALARTQVGISDLGFFIQTDAAINPGNSGGALVSMDGRLAGINTAIFSQSGGSVGIGFAIPANMVASLIEAAETGGRLVRPWIGITGQPVTADLAQNLGLDRPGGVVLNGVYPQGPADRAGLKVGDVVLAVNGREVADPQSLNYRIATQHLGSDARIDILRGGQRSELAVKLVAAPETPPREETRLSGRNPLAGAVVVNLSPAVADELALEGAWSGVAIAAVTPGGIAERIGFAAGDVIVKVNGRKILTVADLKTALERASAPWAISFRRDDQLDTVTIR
jgi:Do/DeqQ family serine protease